MIKQESLRVGLMRKLIHWLVDLNHVNQKVIKPKLITVGLSSLRLNRCITVFPTQRLDGRPAWSPNIMCDHVINCHDHANKDLLVFCWISSWHVMMHLLCCSLGHSQGSNLHNVVINFNHTKCLLVCSCLSFDQHHYLNLSAVCKLLIHFSI